MCSSSIGDGRGGEEYITGSGPEPLNATSELVIPSQSQEEDQGARETVAAESGQTQQQEQQESINPSPDTQPMSRKRKREDHEESVEEDISSRYKSGIGRIVMEDGQSYLVDEAELEASLLRQTAKDVEHFIITFDPDGGILEILSDELTSIIRKVVTFYPSVDLDEEKIVMKKPYGLLYHYWDELEKYVMSGHCDATTKRHFALLETWVEKHIAATWRRIQKNISQSVTLFEDVWALFRPAELLLTQNGFGDDQLHICASVAQRTVLANLLGEEMTALTEYMGIGSRQVIGSLMGGP
jgi:hypothetical protein